MLHNHDRILDNILPDPHQRLAPQPLHIPQSPRPPKSIGFNPLPWEIRQKIYIFASPPPRKILVSPQTASINKRKNRLGSWTSSKCNCEPEQCLHRPVTLSINHESRFETLKHYRVFERERLRKGERRHGQIIYFRPETDTIVIPIDRTNSLKMDCRWGRLDWYTSPTLYDPEMDIIPHIRYVQIVSRLLFWREQGSSHLQAIIGMMTSLQSLEFVYVKIAPGLGNSSLYEREMKRQRDETFKNDCVEVIRDYACANSKHRREIKVRKASTMLDIAKYLERDMGSLILTWV